MSRLQIVVKKQWSVILNFAQNMLLSNYYFCLVLYTTWCIYQLCR